MRLDDLKLLLVDTHDQAAAALRGLQADMARFDAKDHARALAAEAAGVPVPEDRPGTYDRLQLALKRLKESEHSLKAALRNVTDALALEAAHEAEKARRAGATQ